MSVSSVWSAALLGAGSSTASLRRSNLRRTSEGSFAVEALRLEGEVGHRRDQVLLRPGGDLLGVLGDEVLLHPVGAIARDAEGEEVRLDVLNEGLGLGGGRRLAARTRRRRGRGDPPAWSDTDRKRGQERDGKNGRAKEPGGARGHGDLSESEVWLSRTAEGIPSAPAPPRRSGHPRWPIHLNARQPLRYKSSSMPVAFLS